jgi:hypothetical protein
MRWVAAGAILIFAWILVRRIVRHESASKSN